MPEGGAEFTRACVVTSCNTATMVGAAGASQGETLGKDGTIKDESFRADES